MTPDIIWQPQSGPQMDFCASPEFEVCYGGSAGGGKSDGLLHEGLRQVHIPEYRAILFRRKTKNLRRLIDRSQETFPKIFPGAEWKETEKTWCFPSGAKYMLWHMEEEKHKFDHDGQEYHYIGFDELTHFTQTQYLYLVSRCRTSNRAIRCYVRSSAMPMGVGITWVKQRFIDNGANVVVKDGDTGLERKFVPARLEDNKVLTDNDPAYLERLKLLGPKMFRALHKGDWDVIQGASFEELDKSIHMLPPHDPPSGALVWRALDWGYAKPFSVGWYYENHDGQVVRFREWYGWTGKADVGLKMDSREVARKILDFQKDLSVSYGVADPAIESKVDGSPSVADNMRDEGVVWRPAINDRIQGKMELHSRLRYDEEDLDENNKPRSMFYVTSNCKQWWRTVPMMQADTGRPEDVDTKMEDHIYDETRYALMSRRLRKGPISIVTGSDLVTADMYK